MCRIKELREEKNISKAELAKLIELEVDEPSDIDNVDDYRKLDQEQVEKIAMLFGVTVAYLKGNIQYLSKEEREYRKKIKEAAQKEFENFKANCPYDDFDDAISPRVSAMAQLCIAANLIRVTETIEEVSDHLYELNDTIHSYGVASLR
ncbi:hypothetical protein LDX54_08925 [Lactobacillus sp. IBH004]|uniref:helix-turn-helix domain-containing protein n=1 Tax=Lactobacillus sp. IBH004 TaxID=2879107 RepID=UPI0022442CF0|nr:hypothetical protein [Lactobacillus sp. IBH004]UZN41862.1 hypothetical protein LDX54_08925 [Lactobacillus sp. IBH004]